MPILPRLRTIRLRIPVTLLRLIARRLLRPLPLRRIRSRLRIPPRRVVRHSGPRRTIRRPFRGPTVHDQHHDHENHHPDPRNRPKQFEHTPAFPNTPRRSRSSRPARQPIQTHPSPPLQHHEPFAPLSSPARRKPPTAAISGAKAHPSTTPRRTPHPILRNHHAHRPNQHPPPRLSFLTQPFPPRERPWPISQTSDVTQHHSNFRDQLFISQVAFLPVGGIHGVIL